jgi:hypothetical protein
MVVRCSEIPCFMCSAQKCGGLGRVREKRDIPKTTRDCGEKSELYCGEMCLKRSDVVRWLATEGKCKCLRMGTRNSVHSKTEDLLVAGIRCVQAKEGQRRGWKCPGVVKSKRFQVPFCIPDRTRAMAGLRVKKKGRKAGNLDC